MTATARRTLLFCQNFPPMTGGAARRFSEIARRQPSSALTVVTTWAPTDDSSQGPRVIRLSRKSSEREFSGTIRLWPWSGALQRIRAVVRAEKIDRILCGRTLPEGWIALAVRALDRVPYDCFVHGEEVNKMTTRDGEGQGANEGFLLSRRHRAMSRLVYAGASRIITCSETTTDLMREQWSIQPARLRTLLPGVDTRFFHPASPGAPPPHLAEWSGRRVVLAVSRLQRRKGQDQLIRAIDIVRATIPDVLLAIVGGGDGNGERAYLQELVADRGLQGHVSFCAEVSETNLRSCYQHCDLFVLANRQVGCDIEGFGMVLLEAQACGKPVIAGDSGGTREALIDGKTGLVVDCTRADVLAAKLIELLSDSERRAAMGVAARELMTERFDWDVILADSEWLFGGAETW